MSRWLIYALIGAAVLAILWNFGNTDNIIQEISVSELAQQIRHDEISEITVSNNGQEVSITYKDADQGHQHHQQKDEQTVAQRKI
ncbi:MAG: hypothetical protein GWP17_04470, partial [Aquificales bacterium]|nr:hypothetical protein [Aquificales bacterium]